MLTNCKVFKNKKISDEITKSFKICLWIIQTNLENLFSWIIEMNDSKTNKWNITITPRALWWRQMVPKCARVWENLRFAKHVTSNSNSCEQVIDSIIDFFWWNVDRMLQETYKQFFDREWITSSIEHHHSNDARRFTRLTWTNNPDPALDLRINEPVWPDLGSKVMG